MKNLQVLQNKAVNIILDRPLLSSATDGFLLFLDKWGKGKFQFQKVPWIFRKRMKLKLYIE